MWTNQPSWSFLCFVVTCSVTPHTDLQSGTTYSFTLSFYREDHQSSDRKASGCLAYTVTIGNWKISNKAIVCCELFIYILSAIAFRVKRKSQSSGNVGLWKKTDIHIVRSLCEVYTGRQISRAGSLGNIQGRLCRCYSCGTWIDTRLLGLMGPSCYPSEVTNF